MEYFVKEKETRYFIGAEYEGGIDIQSPFDLMPFWGEFFHRHLPTIQNKTEPNMMIGLECYPPDFDQVKLFDYYAMVQVTNIDYIPDNCVAKKLPKGEYISFLIEFDDIRNEIQRVYEYIKEKNIQVNHGFDFEEYINDYDYQKPGAKLYFSLLLKDHDKQ